MAYPRKSQTVTATPAKPGELSILLVFATQAPSDNLSVWPTEHFTLAKTGAMTRAAKSLGPIEGRPRPFFGPRSRGLPVCAP